MRKNLVSVSGFAPPGIKIGTNLLRPGRKRALMQALAYQEGCATIAELLLVDVKSPETEPDMRARVATAYSQVLKGWDAMEDRKRILRGRGVPKPVEARNAQPKRKAPRVIAPLRPAPPAAPAPGPAEPPTAA